MNAPPGDLRFFLLTFAFSFVAGVLGSLLGLGGGVIVVPALTLGMGVDIHVAAGASLVAVIATSSGAAAAYVRDHVTNLRLAMLLELMTTSGALTGALLAGFVPEPFLYGAFSAALFLSAASMLRASRDGDPPPVEHALARRLRLSTSYPDAALGRVVPYVVANVPQGMGLMFLAGGLSGLLGIGSGALKVPAMDRAMRLPMKVSSATSNFMIGVTAAASAWIYLARGEIAPLIAAPVALGVLAGTTVGTRLLFRLRGERIRVVFVVVLFIIAVQMGLRSAGIRFR